MSQFQLDILSKLDTDGSIASTLVSFPNISSQDILSSLNSLKAHEKLQYQQNESIVYKLTGEGQDIVDNGSYEWQLVNLIDSFNGVLKINDVKDSLPGKVGKLGQARAFKIGWIKKNIDNELELTDSLRNLDLKDDTKHILLQLTEDSPSTISSTPQSIDNKTITDLKKRKLISSIKIIDFNIVKGAKFSTVLEKLQTDLTADMITSNSFKDMSFKPYNFNSQGVISQAGAFHPLNKIKQEFRNIFFSMGFTEMPTNQFVESGFWNFDTLFVPQQHPARDLQDTFYIKDPQSADLPTDPEYIANIKAIHEQGKFNSIGYRYNWKQKESQRLVLRTHTTSVSARMLHQLAKDPKPTRLFSIDRVFRNEAVDATHLAEFHQVEGVLADYNITLGNLIHFMREFFSKMGVTGLRFKPTYNPYTEPSMEIFSWHEGLEKWVEIGNSGMFRPEMLLSMGLPEDLRVLGWGLSLERPTMIKYKVQNIRELLGHKVSLDFIESNPAARLDEDLYE